MTFSLRCTYIYIYIYVLCNRYPVLQGRRRGCGCGCTKMIADKFRRHKSKIFHTGPNFRMHVTKVCHDALQGALFFSLGEINDLLIISHHCSSAFRCSLTFFFFWKYWWSFAFFHHELFPPGPLGRTRLRQWFWTLTIGLGHRRFQPLQPQRNTSERSKLNLQRGINQNQGHTEWSIHRYQNSPRYRQNKVQ